MSVLIILMLLGLRLPAAAISDGVPDGTNHPYVGVAVFLDGEDEFLWTCSGTLLSPTVFLTAGHCTDDAASAIVWFNDDLSWLPPQDITPTRCDPEDPEDPEEICSAGSPYSHTNYDPYWSGFPNTYDVGIVELDEPIVMDEYGMLPALDLLDGLETRRGQQNRIIRTVGYGWQMVKPFFEWQPIRYTSTSKIVNLRSHLTDGYNIHTSNNPGKGQGTGGSCLGDSGGPIFYPQDSNIVVGIVSFGLNDNCKGADFAYRIDIEDAQIFINSFLDP
jgi:hypothetical protein